MALLHNATFGSCNRSERCTKPLSTAAELPCSKQRVGLLQSQQQLLVCRASAARQSRWMKVVEAEEYQYYYGYTGSTPPSTAAAAAAQPGTSTVPPTAAASAQQVQQLSQDIRLAGDWTDLLQIAEHQQSLTPTLWLRLLFRLFVLLVEVEWAAADLVELLTDTLPPLLSAAATSLEEAAAAADQQQQQHQKQQQQDQQTFVGQLADMLYSLAVLAGSSRDASSELLHGSNGSSGGDSAGGSSSSSSGSGNSPQACWYQFDGMQRLLDAVAVTGSNWDMDCVSRKDAVSLLWAYGKLLQLQQMHVDMPGVRGNGSNASSSSRSSSRSSHSSNGSIRPQSEPASGSLRMRQQFVSQLCSHITLLIQLSNNTADSAPAQNPGTSFSSPSQNPNSSALTEPWHPDDLIDAVTGLTAAAGAGDVGNKAFVVLQGKRAAAAAAAGYKSQAAASLLDAAAHEVYRQVSNRHSTAGSFTVEGLVDLLQAYCSLDYKDGPSLRMFDAAAGWVVKRVRSRHMQAPGSPSQLAAVAGVFAALRHRSVVVPELLNALDAQACKAAAAAVELAAEDPWSYHASDSSSYCHWLPQHAAAFLQSHIQLGYRPSDTVTNAILTALMLHWEFEQAQQEDRQAGASAAAGELLQSHAQERHGPTQQTQNAPTSHQQQQQLDSQNPQGFAGGLQHQQQQQQQQLQDVVHVLHALAQLGHTPGQRVLNTLLQQAWLSNPQEHLSHKALVTLLFSTAQLAAAPRVIMSVTAAEAVGAQPAASAAAATAAAFTAAATDSSADIAGAVSVAGDSCRRNSTAAAAAAVPDLAAVSAVIDQLILSTMPEYEQQQQQDGGSLTVEELIRVLWSCCVFGSLDIAQFGWLLVAVAGGPWQRLGQEQLCVIKQGELLLGQDGADMASEVLPAQLLRRVEAAWSKQQQPAHAGT